jgi:hypothetical protein
MRQTALIVLLAHSGQLRAGRAGGDRTIDRIFTRIGASDDLASGRSTFMVEMSEAANILHNATPHSLVLIDEIGRGTSTFDGLALAWACAAHLAGTVRAFTLFATHYFELTRLPDEQPGIVNVHLDAVEHGDTIAFLHRVQDGPARSQLWPASSGAGRGAAGGDPAGPPAAAVAGAADAAAGIAGPVGGQAATGAVRRGHASGGRRVGGTRSLTRLRRNRRWRNCGGRTAAWTERVDWYCQVECNQRGAICRQTITRRDR